MNIKGLNNMQVKMYHAFGYLEMRKVNYFE